MLRLAAALLLISSPVAAHDARAAEVFTFTSSEQTVTGAEPGALVTGFKASLEYGDGHRESVAGQCTARGNPPGAAFSGRHNGLTGLITYRSGPEGLVGVGRWND